MYGSDITDFQLVTLIVGVFLPILVALVTKHTTNPSTRSLVLLVLTAVSAVLNSWLTGPDGFNWSQAIWGAVTTFVIGVATLYGLWKPTGVSDAAKSVLVK